MKKDTKTIASIINETTTSASQGAREVSAVQPTRHVVLESQASLDVSLNSGFCYV